MIFNLWIFNLWINKNEKLLIFVPPLVFIFGTKNFLLQIFFQEVASTCVFQVHLLICCFFFLCFYSRFAVPHHINSNSTSFQISRRDHAFGRCLWPFLMQCSFFSQSWQIPLHEKFTFINMYHMPFKWPRPPTGRTRMNQQLTLCGFLPRSLSEPQLNDLRHSSDSIH